MSTQTQRRRRARAEEPETGAEPETEEQESEQEPEPEPEPQPEPGSPEAQARKIDNARRKYRRDLEGIVGDLGDVAECPFCDGLGFVEGAMNLSVRTDTEMCPDCKGLGRMITGSRVPEHAALPCPRCSSSGYIHVQPPQAPAPPNVTHLTLPEPPAPMHGYWDPATQTFHPYGEQAAT